MLDKETFISLMEQGDYHIVIEDLVDQINAMSGVLRSILQEELELEDDDEFETGWKDEIIKVLPKEKLNFKA